MIDEDLVRRALDVALSQNVDFAEARIQIDEEESIYMRSGVIEAYGISISGGFSIRVLKNGAFGFGCTEKLGNESIKNAIMEAVKLAGVAKLVSLADFGDF